VVQKTVWADEEDSRVKALVEEGPGPPPRHKRSKKASVKELLFCGKEEGGGILTNKKAQLSPEGDSAQFH